MTTWPTIRLGDAGDWFGGGTPSKANPEFWTDGDFPWLSPKDMGDIVIRSTRNHITEAAIRGSAVRRVPAGSVAVVVRSGILERTLPVGLVPFEVTLNQDMKALAPRPDIDARWIAWGLRAFERDLLAGTRKRGTTVASIEFSKLMDYQIPLPTLAGQRHVLEVLEEHLSRLDAAQKSAQSASLRAQTLMRSILFAGLRGDLVEEDTSEGTGPDLLKGGTNFLCTKDDRVWVTPATWTWARLGDLFEVNVGATPSRSASGLWNGDLPWVSSGEVAFCRIASTRERISRAAAGNPATRIHPPGTVMLAMIGEGKTRGQAAILDIEAAHNQNCASIRVSSTPILPEYIYGYLEERYLETRRGGSGGQQPALNKSAIQRFAVPIPPLGTQRKLVAAWADARNIVGRLTTEVDTTGARNEALRRSLLAAAFAGCLTRPGMDTYAVEDSFGA